MNNNRKPLLRRAGNSMRTALDAAVKGARSVAVDVFGVEPKVHARIVEYLALTAQKDGLDPRVVSARINVIGDTVFVALCEDGIKYKSLTVDDLIDIFGGKEARQVHGLKERIVSSVKRGMQQVAEGVNQPLDQINLRIGMEQETATLWLCRQSNFLGEISVKQVLKYAG